MGEKESEPFQFTFNGFLKVAFQGSRVTSDAGLILVRELDERLGLEAIITEHLSDSAHFEARSLPVGRLRGWKECDEIISLYVGSRGVESGSSQSAKMEISD